jgi:C-terminal processing protease CtpA/Prc
MGSAHPVILTFRIDSVNTTETEKEHDETMPLASDSKTLYSSVAQTPSSPKEDVAEENDVSFNDDDGNGMMEQGHRRVNHRTAVTLPPSQRKGLSSYAGYFLMALLIALVVSLIYSATIRYKSLSSKCAGAGNNAVAAHHTSTITYDPSIIHSAWDPFHLSSPSSESIPYSPQLPWSNVNESSSILGYMMQPDIVNNTVVFVSEGNLYWTTLRSLDVPTAAVRLTFTIGNVRNPKINPVHPYLIAFTATYQERRDVYLLDLRAIGRSGGNLPAQRLTYSDSPYGILSLSGWSHQGTVLTYATTSLMVGLRDLRLYDIAIAQGVETSTTNPSNPIQVSEIRPVPLAQATEGVRLSQEYNDAYDDVCMIFVRYKQGSHTARYVGGTAERLWLYCTNATRAVPLTHDYRGTSKNPTIYYSSKDQQRYLLFLSDRSHMGEHARGPSVFQSPPHWRATTMNLWAVPLPKNLKDIYTAYDDDIKHWSNDSMFNISFFPHDSMIQLTHVSCEFNGLSLQEYTLDPITGSVVLRIGADLHHLSAEVIRAKLLGSSDDTGDHLVPSKLPIQVLSDFHEQQERLIKVNVLKHLSNMDVFTTHFDTAALLMTVRGQVWVAPVSEIDTSNILPYEGAAGLNLPPRRYRVIPGAMSGGAIRVLVALHIPLYTAETPLSNTTAAPNRRRLALVLATDPVSPTAELGFFIVEVQSDHKNQFADIRHWPDPFVGGHLNGGSTQQGGLGTIKTSSVAISPCGRRFGWTDTDDRICVMTMPIYTNSTSDRLTFQCLPALNDQGEPLTGSISSLRWSPGGRYLGIEHTALNQFSIISIADCGSPESTEGNHVNDISLGPILQMTPSRFNSYNFIWGKSSFDVFWSNWIVALGQPPPADVSTTLYFLSDRDVITDVTSPWGSRAPFPHFNRMEGHVYALPLPLKLTTPSLDARYPGGGSAEVFYDDLRSFKDGFAQLAADPSVVNMDGVGRNLEAALMKKLSHSLKGRNLSEDQRNAVTLYIQQRSLLISNSTLPPSPFLQDAQLDLSVSDNNLTAARKAYRLARIPKAQYYTIVTQTWDDGSLVLIDQDDDGDKRLKYFSANPFPSDVLDEYTVSGISLWGESTSRRHIGIVSLTGKISVVSNSASGLASLVRDVSWSQNQADTGDMAISVWPALEYRQMYSDAWRLMRDYFYDANLHNVDWPTVFSRYTPLVQRCSKREELDDVLGQMSSETSALHSFVYGGEYNTPIPTPLEAASLGVYMKRSPEWKGYIVLEIPLRDPDFDLVDDGSVYCPLSDQALRPTGQKGLAVGDVVVAVNGESVLSVPDINMMLRGTVGRSIRLEVLRLSSGTNASEKTKTAVTESIVVVPISVEDANSLLYNAWEWKSRARVKKLASDEGFTVGYIHMQTMTDEGEDAFARGYFPDYDKDALILDVRHNQGGNIDSWILAILQRKAFMYWAVRSGDRRVGDFDWDEQFAFRGKLIVLVDELTASNGEGVARGVSELSLGKTLGTRTWGGGIWGSSVNKLVDGGIAAAPQWGIFNAKFGWGGGIEMSGLEPDVVVDNDPREAFDGIDTQLELAIKELKIWLTNDPLPPYETPSGARPDMSLVDDCHA